MCKNYSFICFRYGIWCYLILVIFFPNALILFCKLYWNFLFYVFVFCNNLSIFNIYYFNYNFSYWFFSRISLFKDFITGGYLLTHKDSFFPRSEVHRFAAAIIDSKAKEQTRIRIPPPTILKPIELWTGKQVFDLLICSYDMFKKGF